MKKIIGISSIFIIVVIMAIVIFFLCFPKKYQNEIKEYSGIYGLDRYLVASVINIESSYDKEAVSSAGAMGLMQLLPSTAQDVGRRVGKDIVEEDLFDEKTNIELGCYYLSYLLKMFDGNITNVLCAYNWGLQNVKEWIDKGNVDEAGTIINIPVKETRDYIGKYRLNRFIYKNIYGY